MIVPPEAPPVPGVAGGGGCLTPPRPPPRPAGAWPPGPLRTAMRTSVIFKFEGFEFRLTFWGYASKSANRPIPIAAAPRFRSERRAIAFSLLYMYSPLRQQE